MAENSAIEWTDHTFNPWIGCTKVSPGCDHCYAEARMDTRLHRVHWGPGQQRQLTKTWGDPVRWNKAHETFFAKYGRRQRVFCASLADVFDNEVPEIWRIDLFTLIEETPHLDWLLLTKRIGNAAKYLPWSVCSAPWPNVWIGATVVNQEEADRDIPKLLRTPARVRFLSMEPLLGPVDLTIHLALQPLYRGDLAPATIEHRPRLHWVIVGGESGRSARPMHPDWARSLRDQCAIAGVPFLFKQWGEWHPESSANYAIGPRQYRYGKVEGLSLMPSGEICVRNTADAPASRPAIVNAEAMQAWHDRCRRAEGKPDAENYPFGYQWMHRIGKKAAGRLLDGMEHSAFPEIGQ